jgi:hypothetical protein
MRGLRAEGWEVKMRKTCSKDQRDGSPDYIKNGTTKKVVVK